MDKKKFRNSFLREVDEQMIRESFYGQSDAHDCVTRLTYIDGNHP